MKITKIYTIGLLIAMFMNLSCDKLKEATSTEIDVNPPAINFNFYNSTHLSTKSSARELVIMYSGTLHTGIHERLHENGFTYDNVKGLSLTRVKIKVNTPSSYDAKGLIGTKIFIGDKKDLCAEATTTEGKNILIFKIIKNNLNNYIRRDNLPILISGPSLVGDIRMLALSLNIYLRLNVSPL